MPTQDTTVTIHPYFKVREGHLEAFKAKTAEMVAQTREKEPKCRFYGFSFFENTAFCREGYADADGVLAHLENIGPLLAEALEMSEITRLEIHGAADELDKLREQVADLKPVFYTLEHGFQRGQ